MVLLETGGWVSNEARKAKGGGKLDMRPGRGARTEVGEVRVSMGAMPAVEGDVLESGICKAAESAEWGKMGMLSC